ncbi:MAG: hypothetical protein VSS75_010970 [Candidatus Parabeggiatoa sp.]|nr:hypothetical protein [Candidatus Parabeggiatoa sp.]
MRGGDWGYLAQLRAEVDLATLGTKLNSLRSERSITFNPFGVARFNILGLIRFCTSYKRETL